MNETLGKIHFFGSLVCMNVVFMPMFLIGMAGVSRRLFDGGATYAFAQPVLHWNVVSSWGAWILAIFQIPFIFNFFWSIWKGEKIDGQPVAGHDDRVGGSLASPHGNFLYGPGSVPRDPTSTAFPARPRTSCRSTRPDSRWTFPTPSRLRRDTGLTNGKIGIWLFLASEVMLFGACLRATS
jgi:cytochrome c oxidase subunit 1